VRLRKLIGSIIQTAVPKLKSFATAFYLFKFLQVKKLDIYLL